MLCIDGVCCTSVLGGGAGGAGFLPPFSTPFGLFNCVFDWFVNLIWLSSGFNGCCCDFVKSSDGRLSILLVNCDCCGGLLLFRLFLLNKLLLLLLLLGCLSENKNKKKLISLSTIKKKLEFYGGGRHAFILKTIFKKAMHLKRFT